MDDCDDQAELASYVWAYFPQFFTPVEAKAGAAHFADLKAAAGYDSVARFIRQRSGLGDDPAVVAALADGVEVFRRRAANRVLRDHAAEVVVSRCPACGRMTRTPTAKQCFHCGADWHPKPLSAGQSDSA